MPLIWIVDDEENMRVVLSMLLEGQGYDFRCFSSGDEALQALEADGKPDGFLSDLRMPGIDGLELLDRVKALYPQIPYVVLTGYGTIELAVQAIKKGAEDFLTKPFNKDEVLQILKRLSGHSQSRRQEKTLTVPFIHVSSSMQDLYKLLEKLSASSVPVLISGESGTGKEVVARALHDMTPNDDDRFKRPFVALNCAAVPTQLFESELFGHRKGAFTGAVETTPGKIAAAQGGTLFLDEIGDLPLEAQIKLLRFLEDYRYTPLGSTEERTADLRIICATNRNLQDMIGTGAFRQDLYYRISTFVLSLPPLKERPEDILPLADFFLNRFSRTPVTQPLSQEASARLLSHPWPGNVRELRSVIQRAVILTPLGTIPAASIVFDGSGEGLRGSSPGEESLSALELNEKRMLQGFLRSTRGNISRTAELIGVSRSTLRYRLEKYGLTGQSHQR